MLSALRASASDTDGKHENVTRPCHIVTAKKILGYRYGQQIIDKEPTPDTTECTVLVTFEAYTGTVLIYILVLLIMGR